ARITDTPPRGPLAGSSPACRPHAAAIESRRRAGRSEQERAGWRAGRRGRVHGRFAPLLGRLVRGLSGLLAGLFRLRARRLAGLVLGADLHLPLLGPLGLGQCRRRRQARSEHQHRQSDHACSELPHDVTPLARLLKTTDAPTVPLQPTNGRCSTEQALCPTLRHACQRIFQPDAGNIAAPIRCLWKIALVPWGAGSVQRYPTVSGRARFLPGGSRGAFVVRGMALAPAVPRRMRTVTFVVLLAALGAQRVGAQGTTTTVVVTTTTTSTTTTLPPTPPSTLCTCNNASNVCEVKKGTYPVNPGSDLDFRPCALTLDTGATIALTSGAGSGFTIEATSLTMSTGSTIQGAPSALAPNDGGFVGITVSGAILVDAGARISMDGQDAGGNEIDLTAGGTITLEGGAGTDVVSAKALSSGGDGGILNVTASGDVTIDATLSVASGAGQGGGGDICITTNKAKVTVNGPLDASGGDFDGGCIDIESDLDLMTTAAAKLNVDGGDLSGSGGQIILDANVQGPVTINGPVSGKGAGSSQNTSEGGG